MIFEVHSHFVVNSVVAFNGAESYLKEFRMRIPNYDNSGTYENSEYAHFILVLVIFNTSILYVRWLINLLPALWNQRHSLESCWEMLSETRQYRRPVCCTRTECRLMQFTCPSRFGTRGCWRFDQCVWARSNFSLFQNAQLRFNRGICKNNPMSY